MFNDYIINSVGNRWSQTWCLEWTLVSMQHAGSNIQETPISSWEGFINGNFPSLLRITLASLKTLGYCVGSNITNFYVKVHRPAFSRATPQLLSCHLQRADPKMRFPVTMRVRFRFFLSFTFVSSIEPSAKSLHFLLKISLADLRFWLHVPNLSTSS